jgi:hypothetical protein
MCPTKNYFSHSCFARIIECIYLNGGKYMNPLVCFCSPRDLFEQPIMKNTDQHMKSFSSISIDFRFLLPHFLGALLLPEISCHILVNLNYFYHNLVLDIVIIQHYNKDCIVPIRAMAKFAPCLF